MEKAGLEQRDTKPAQQRVHTLAFWDHVSKWAVCATSLETSRNGHQLVRCSRSGAAAGAFV